MCQGDICFKEDTTRILNLSNHLLSDAETKLLNRGLNFALKKKSNNLDCQIEMEKLYMDIIEQDKVKILEKENLKTKLKCFGIRHRPDNIPDPLTKDEITALKVWG